MKNISFGPKKTKSILGYAILIAVGTFGCTPEEIDEVTTSVVAELKQATVYIENGGHYET